ncbi:MAG: hypothetical protein WC350_04385 [Candidatus Micrarchaeia archaeon]|jgi:hypothetical protein
MMPAATQAQAPQLLPAERRMEQAKFLFEQFGIGFDSLSTLLSVQKINAGTPMEIDLGSRWFNPADVSREGLIVSSLIQQFGAERVRGGIESFCNSEDDFYALVGAVFAAHSASTFGSISDSTNQWLFGLKVERDEDGKIKLNDDGTPKIEWDIPGSRLASTLLRDMRGKEDWLTKNYGQFSSAAIFYVWAMQNGFDADFVNKAGEAAFKELWIPAATVGQFLEYDNTQGSWVLHGRDRAKGWDRDTVGLAMDALRRLGPMSMAPTTFAEEAQPERERTQLDEFRSKYDRTLSISDTLDRVLREGRGWAGDYSRLLSNYDLTQVEEGAVFYAWARKNGMSDQEINDLGSPQYKDNWALAALLGKHLSPSRANASEYVLKTDEATAFRADLDTFRVSQSPVVRVAEGETAETATGLAQFAAQVGVSEEFMAQAVDLIRRYGTARFSFDFSDVAAGTIKEGMLNGKHTLSYRPEVADGEAFQFTNDELVAAVRSAAESQGIRFRQA